MLPDSKQIRKGKPQRRKCFLTPNQGYYTAAKLKTEIYSGYIVTSSEVWQRTLLYANEYHGQYPEDSKKITKLNKSTYYDFINKYQIPKLNTKPKRSKAKIAQIIASDANQFFQDLIQPTTYTEESSEAKDQNFSTQPTSFNVFANKTNQDSRTTQSRYSLSPNFTYKLSLQQFIGNLSSNQNFSTHDCSKTHNGYIDITYNSLFQTKIVEDLSKLTPTEPLIKKSGEFFFSDLEDFSWNHLEKEALSGVKENTKVLSGGFSKQIDSSDVDIFFCSEFYQNIRQDEVNLDPK